MGIPFPIHTLPPGPCGGDGFAVRWSRSVQRWVPVALQRLLYRLLERTGWIHIREPSPGAVLPSGMSRGGRSTVLSAKCGSEGAPNLSKHKPFCSNGPKLPLRLERSLRRGTGNVFRVLCFCTALSESEPRSAVFPFSCLLPLYGQFQLLMSCTTKSVSL